MSAWWHQTLLGVPVATLGPLHRSWWAALGLVRAVYFLFRG